MATALCGNIAGKLGGYREMRELRHCAIAPLLMLLRGEKLAARQSSVTQKSNCGPFSTFLCLSLNHRAIEETMNASAKGLLAIVALSLPTVAYAQSSDVTYCAALVGKYQAFLDQSQKRGEAPQSLSAKAAVEKCKAGDTSGIPDIEKALRDAKIDLPPRT
jgi:hypothetical protein